MAFHEVVFPTDISYGSTGGPGFSTSIVEVDSGFEERVARWSAPKHKYNAKYGVKSLDQLSTLISFYVARQGPAAGFRYKDFLDFTTATNHRAASAFTDVDIAVADGTKTTFQLIKKYVSGTITRTRNITKPVSGTVTVGKDGVNQASGWSINTTTGVVTFTTAPTSGVVINAGCEFDVPVRFGSELDEVLSLAIDSFDTGGLDDIPIAEINDDGTELQDEFFFGGAHDHGVLAANISISIQQGRVQTFQANAAGWKIILPDATNLPTGGPHFYLANQGSQSAEVRNTSGGTIGVVASATTRTVVLAVNSIGSKIWLMA